MTASGICRILLILIVSSASLAASDDTVHRAFETFFLDTLQKMVGQDSILSMKGSEKYEEFAMKDTSNEEISKATTQQILARSGFKFENYHSLSDDGYQTQIVRVVNPLADRTKLKQPPVMLFHGGNIDPILYLWASAIQHHPERWPRPINGGPITSWNRSLPLALANNGYDVFLVATRGVYQSRGHVGFNRTGSGNNQSCNSTDGKRGIIEYNLLSPSLNSFKYWNYSFDEIIQYEAPRQIDKVLEITGAQNVTFVAMSLSTQWSLALFSSNQQYAAKIHQYVCMTPIINNKGANKFILLFHELLSRMPDEIGNLLFQDVILSQPMRDFILDQAKDKRRRYTQIKGIISVLIGASAKFTTFLEGPVLGHFLQPVGFKQLKHYSQQVTEGRLQKFDYGAKRNYQLYNSMYPPRYNLSDFRIKNWMVISGRTDQLATVASVEQILDEVPVKPYKHISIPGYNHIDLWAAFDCDTLVNLPILDYLDKFQLMPPVKPVE